MEQYLESTWAGSYRRLEQSPPTIIWLWCRAHKIVNPKKLSLFPRSDYDCYRKQCSSDRGVRSQKLGKLGEVKGSNGIQTFFFFVSDF